VVRLARAQYRDAVRDMAGETLAGQHGAGLGRFQRGDEFGIGNEGQVAGLCLVHRRYPRQAAGQVCPVTRIGAGQRSDIRHAQPC